MKNVLKRVVLATLCAMLIVPVFTMNVSANNCKDSIYHFSFKSFDNQTGTRDKTDTSSSYMRCTSADNSYTAHVYAVANGKVKDCSMGHTYRFSTNTKHFMVNCVYESGLRNAGIYAVRDYGYAYNASGWWSPDSVPE